MPRSGSRRGRTLPTSTLATTTQSGAGERGRGRSKHSEQTRGSAGAGEPDSPLMRKQLCPHPPSPAPPHLPPCSWASPSFLPEPGCLLWGCTLCLSFGGPIGFPSPGIADTGTRRKPLITCRVLSARCALWVVSPVPRDILVLELNWKPGTGSPLYQREADLDMSYFP